MFEEFKAWLEELLSIVYEFLGKIGVIEFKQ